MPNNQTRKRKRIDWCEKLRIVRVIEEEFGGQVRDFLRNEEWKDRGYKQQRLNEWVQIGVANLEERAKSKKILYLYILFMFDFQKCQPSSIRAKIMKKYTLQNIFYFNGSLL